MRVLIGVDGSAGSCAAAELASRLLSGQTDEVLLYYAPPQIRVRSGRQPPTQALDRIQGYLADAVFGAARRQLPASFQRRVQQILGTQSPAHGLLVAADEYRADMIVVGARGTGPIRGLNVGSVVRAVVRHATVPVLVVRPPKEGGAKDPLRVLLASDGSEASKHACEVIKKLSWPATTVGRVISVVESSLAAHVPDWLRAQLDQQEADSLGFGHLEPTEEERNRVQEELVHWCGQLPSIFAGQEPLVAVGHPSKEILDAIDSQNVDLVIVGARGLGPIGRVLHGSTSEHLLSQAPCSVLIVRQHEKP